MRSDIAPSILHALCSTAPAKEFAGAHLFHGVKIGCNFSMAIIQSTQMLGIVYFKRVFYQRRLHRILYPVSEVCVWVLRGKNYFTKKRNIY